MDIVSNLVSSLENEYNVNHTKEINIIIVIWPNKILNLH